MKIIAVCLLIGGFVWAGCATSPEPPMVYKRGGMYDTDTGMFRGDLFTEAGPDDSCTVNVHEADSIVRLTITRDSSREVLDITGPHAFVREFMDFGPGTIAKHRYSASVTSNLSVVYSQPAVVEFSDDGESLHFDGLRDTDALIQVWVQATRVR
jgi:hypothetical protein